jgi:transcriptional regulator GlxA family with amidase domain
VTRVVFLLVPGLHLLDLAGPAQAFATAADFGCGYELAYVAEQEDVPAAQGVTIRAATQWPALAEDDLIIVPGWRANPVIAGTGPLTDATLTALAAHHARGGTVASVCAGADALGRAHLLDGRRCTTHHDIQDELATRYPRATVIRDVLYVIDDRVATSAGIASGIDLALHLIAVRDSPARWSSTPAATGTSSRPAPCCGTATTSATPRTAPRITSRRSSPARCPSRKSPASAASASAPLPASSPGRLA